MSAELLRAFLSYSHKDREHKDKFLSHFSSLRLTEQIAIWEDGELVGGDAWDKTIKEQLTGSNLIIFLVSANLISSEYSYTVELQTALELHKSKKAEIIPVLLSSVSLEGMELDGIQRLPTMPPSIEGWPNQDDAWVNVIEGMRKKIKELQENLRTWNPTAGRAVILELFKPPEKLEEACNKTLDFAMNFGTDEHQFEAVNLRAKLDEIQKAEEKLYSPNASTSLKLSDILDNKSALRTDVFRLLKSIMVHLSPAA